MDNSGLFASVDKSNLVRGTLLSAAGSGNAVMQKLAKYTTTPARVAGFKTAPPTCRTQSEPANAKNPICCVLCARPRPRRDRTHEIGFSCWCLHCRALLDKFDYTTVCSHSIGFSPAIFFSFV